MIWMMFHCTTIQWTIKGFVFKNFKLIVRIETFQHSKNPFQFLITVSYLKYLNFLRIWFDFVVKQNMAKLKKTASGPRTRAARKPRGKYEIIRNKIEEVKSLDYSRWKAACVAEHFISAGRMRLTKHELYGFPSYCRFPYNSYENE